MKKFDFIFFALFVLYLIVKRFFSDYIPLKYLSVVFIVIIMLLLILRTFIDRKKERN